MVRAVWIQILSLETDESLQHETDESLDNGGINITRAGVSNFGFPWPLKPFGSDVIVMQAEMWPLQASTVNVKLAQRCRDAKQSALEDQRIFLK